MSHIESNLKINKLHDLYFHTKKTKYQIMSYIESKVKKKNLLHDQPFRVEIQSILWF